MRAPPSFSHPHPKRGGASGRQDRRHKTHEPKGTETRNQDHPPRMETRAGATTTDPNNKHPRVGNNKHQTQHHTKHAN